MQEDNNQYSESYHCLMELTQNVISVVNSQFELNKLQTESISIQSKALQEINNSILQQNKIITELIRLNKKLIMQFNVMIILFCFVITLIFLILFKHV